MERKNNEQVAHIWAQGNGREAQSHTGNFRCKDNHLYSYSTCIGRHLGDAVLISSNKYSVTTQGKHLGPARNAIRDGVLTIYTGIGLREYERGGLLSNLKLLADQIRSMNKHLAKARRARSSLTCYLTSAHHAYKGAVWALAEARKRDLTTLEEGKTEWRILREDDVVRFVEDTPHSGMMGRAQFLASYAPWAEKKLEAIRCREIFENLKRIEREKARNNELLANVTRWKAGENLPVPYHPTFLRVVGDTVQTSRGAEVPLSEAIQLLTRVMRGEDVVGTKIGHFEVRSCDSETIVIGCHTLSVREAINALSGIEPATSQSVN